MQSINYIKLIFDYHYWATYQLFECVMTVSKNDYQQEIVYGLGSLHCHMVHLMWAEANKLARICNYDAIDWITSDFPRGDLLINQWQQVEQDYRTYLSRLTIDELNREVMKNCQPQLVYEILLHIVNHGTDHRTQMLRMISDFGGQTFPQDMAYYFRKLRTNQ